MTTECLPPCWICHKIWTRTEFDKWYFFHDILVCKHHEGAAEWYNGAVKMADERMALDLNQEGKK